MKVLGGPSRTARDERVAESRGGTRLISHRRWLVFGMLILMLSSCTPPGPEATVEGPLRLDGKPLDNCLITFLPGAAKGEKSPHSTGLTDGQGRFRLRHDTQQEGVVVGVHRVVIQDMSVATGVPRRDHGTVDAGMEDSPASRIVRRSRVPEPYTAVATTPLSLEVEPEHQVMDIDIPR